MLMRPRMSVILSAGWMALLAALAGGCDAPIDSSPLPAAGDAQYRDAWLARDIKARLAADDLVGPFLVEVQARDGVVYLQGTVPTEEMRERAGQLAEDPDYVLLVRNNIVVTSSAPPGT
ncbi:MAG: hypothetical protein BIFFINMI_00154 [Phycisphaerae bacterium]|nr:hypothetical protein [Phycisphaerae bacterium]